MVIYVIILALFSVYLHYQFRIKLFLTWLEHAKPKRRTDIRVTAWQNPYKSSIDHTQRGVDVALVLMLRFSEPGCFSFPPSAL